MEMKKWNLQLFGQEPEGENPVQEEPVTGEPAANPAPEKREAEEALEALSPALQILAKRHGFQEGQLDYTALAEAVSREEAARITQARNQGFRQHILSLEQQGQKLRQQGFSDFDLRKELQNPVFARMTAPGSGISVEDAYYAVHRRELQSKAMEAAARNLSNAIRSGSQRPRESGMDGQAPSVTSFDYRRASREQREALKKQIRQAAAEGRKLYPGM